VRSGVWIRGPIADGALAMSWIPFAVAAHSVEGHPDVLRTLVAGVMFLSFTHQPLTLPLVYASPWRRRSRPGIFLWAPLVAVAGVALFSQLSLVLVAVVGALWNAEHTLMQRYGITRIYGRQGGDSHGGTERWMLVGWLVVPLLVIAARGQLAPIVDRLDISNVDSTAVKILAQLPTEARYLLVPIAVATAFLTVQWLRTEFRTERTCNPGKHLYVASTAALFLAALFDPIAAVVGFVGSHSLEYFFIVDRSVSSEARHPGPLGSLVRLPHGRTIFWGFYAFVVTGLFLLLYRLASPRLLIVTVLAIGALHFFYDSFIWKLRKPEVAASLATSPAPVSLSA